jgi:AcrR family transcriptional regulator
VRADAVRNLDAVLQTGARLLAADPSTPIATIAAEAGVDRRTVYRRFATREALLVALANATLDGAEQALDEARLTEAPVAVALHRYVESIVSVSRRWPVDFGRLESGDAATDERRQRVRSRVDAFVDRLVAEGLLRADLPAGWARAMLDQLVSLAAHRFPGLEPPQAADLVVDTLRKGVGTR